MEKTLRNPRQAGSQIGLEDISLTSILRDLLRNILLIALSALIFAGGFYIVKNETFKPQYKSEATFLVSTRDGSFDAYSNLSTTIQLNQVFKMILDSDALKEAVKTDLGLTELDATITAANVEETNLLVLSVVAPTPSDSYKILCSVIKNYPIFSNEVMGNAVMDVFEAPSVPTKPINSVGGFKWAVIGFMAGAVLMAAAVILLSYFKDTVKNERQVEKKLDTKLYAVIPHEKKRKRKGLLVTDLTSSFGFREAYNKLRSRVEREYARKGFKVFAISSPLENEGKTTVAANLALSLAKKKYKVLMADFDLRNPAVAKIFELEVGDREFTSAFGDSKVQNIEKYIIVDDKTGIDFLACTKQIDNVNNVLRRGVLSSIVNELKHRYDYVIIDTPPVAFVSDIDDVASASDASILVVREDYTKAMVINDSIDSMTRTGTPLLGAVLNNSLGSSEVFGSGYAYYGSYGSYGKYSGYNKYGKYAKYSTSSKKEGGNER